MDEYSSAPSNILTHLSSNPILLKVVCSSMRCIGPCHKNRICTECSVAYVAWHLFSKKRKETSRTYKCSKKENQEKCTKE